MKAHSVDSTIIITAHMSPPRGTSLSCIKPPPIPGMRPPLGAPGGPVPAPKSSMGFVMPIYTICIIIFFVYTLAKILFKRTGSPYEPVQPDAQFRRRVFRDDSRRSSDRLVVTAISGLVAEVQQQMQASYDQSQQRQEAQDNARSYTNGTVIHKGPVQIVASEYRGKEKEPSFESVREENGINHKSIDKSELSEKDSKPYDVVEDGDGNKDEIENKNDDDVEKETNEKEVIKPVETVETEKDIEIETTEIESIKEPSPIREIEKELLTLKEEVQSKLKAAEDFLSKELEATEDEKKQSTPELLEEALKEDSPLKEDSTSKEDSPSREEADNGSVKHEAEDVKLIYLETDIPEQSRVLVTDFEDQADKQPARKHKHSDLVVSGKMTLSLIQDPPRDTPERELESTMDEFTTASGATQAVEKEDDLSEEEIEEEIEVEEIEEEVEVEEEEVEVEIEEVEEEEEEETPKPKKK